MDAIECIRTRKSIRGFKPDPVSTEILKKVIEAAQWSPSYKNSQPWEIIVLSGGKKEGLTQILIDLFGRDTPPCPDIPEPGSWPDRENKHIADLYRKRAKVSGIDLGDPEVLKKAKIANFNFYRAPHVIYLFQEASLPLWSLFDLGLFAQSLMLSAHAHGLGTVPQAFATDYARDIKKFLGIPETKRLVLGISIGYPDPESPANSFRTDRAEMGDIARWVE